MSCWTQGEAGLMLGQCDGCDLVGLDGRQLALFMLTSSAVSLLLPARRQPPTSITHHASCLTIRILLNLPPFCTQADSV